MPNLLPADKGLEEAARLLRSGGVVAFPTETVYGLGANALDAVAVARIFEAKKRPLFDPLIVHIAHRSDLLHVVHEIPRVAETLIDRFWPGPLALVMERAHAIPNIVTAGLDTVAVRLPQHPIAQELIARAGVPIAAPSANTFGRLSPTLAQHVVEDLGDAADLILDGGPAVRGVESTIVDVTREVPVVLRFGALSLEELQEAIGDVDVQLHSSSNPTAPGQLDSHYATRLPLHLVTPQQKTPSAKAGYLAFVSPPAGDWAEVEILSPTGDLREAASRLFNCLHRLDASGVDVIYAELVPDVDLGRAINDRLRRGAIH